MTDGEVDESYKIKILDIDNRARVNIHFKCIRVPYVDDATNNFTLSYSMGDINENVEDQGWIIRPVFEPIQLPEDLFSV